jgi:hypothetical protein
MRPDVKPDLSLLNFVHELKEVVSLKSFPKKVGELIDTFYGLIRTYQPFRHRRLQVAGSTAKQISGLHLEFSFAVRPFIDAVIKIYGALTKYREGYRALVEKAKEPQRRHYRKVLTAGYVSSGVEIVSAGEELLVETTYDDVFYHASCKYSFELPVEGKWIDNQCKYLLDRLGVNDNPKTLWDAIPFSFVLDWAITIGPWLGSLGTTNLGIRTELTDFCHSVKQVSTTSYNYRIGGTFVTALWSEYHSHYVRLPTLPVGQTIRIRLPSLYAFSLGLALVVQVVTKKVRRLARSHST